MHLYDTKKGDTGRQYCIKDLKLNPAQFELKLTAPINC